jgi:hypothetical protein
MSNPLCDPWRMRNQKGRKKLDRKLAEVVADFSPAERLALAGELEARATYLIRGGVATPLTENPKIKEAADRLLFAALGKN